jgi:hypothetical protein
MSYVPVTSEAEVRINANKGKGVDTVNYAVCKNFFYYLPSVPDEDVRLVSKAFITPSQNWLASFSDKYCFVIEFETYDPKLAHPKQAVIEIYNATSQNPEDALMELEYHSPFRTLQSGESIKTNQRWIIYPYKGKNNPDKHMRFLTKKMAKN